MTDLSIAQRFDTLLASIEPDPRRLKLAQKLPATLRQELARSDRLHADDPARVTLLVGSYPRHTAVRRIKDVDIATVVARYYKHHSPTVVFKDLEAALKEAKRRKVLRNVEHTSQRRSFRCYVFDADFQLDIVPVVAVNGDPYGDLLIPDRDLGRWCPTRSIGYLNLLPQLNRASQDKLVPLIKLFKHWKNIHEIDRYQAKSFWLEAMLVGLVRSKKISFDAGWPEITASTFQAVYARCVPAYKLPRNVPVIPDPMITGNNVAYNWKREGFATFFAKLRKASEASARAVAATDDAHAIAEWRRVFGPGFAPQWTDRIWSFVGIGAVAGGVTIAVARAARSR